MFNSISPSSPTYQSYVNDNFDTNREENSHLQEEKKSQVNENSNHSTLNENCDLPFRQEKALTTLQVKLKKTQSKTISPRMTLPESKFMIRDANVDEKYFNNLITFFSEKGMAVTKLNDHQIELSLVHGFDDIDDYLEDYIETHPKKTSEQFKAHKHEILKEHIATFLHTFDLSKIEEGNIFPEVYPLDEII